jgi:hypothetical protein
VRLRVKEFRSEVCAIRPRDRAILRDREVAEKCDVFERLKHRAPKLGREIDFAVGAVFELTQIT